MLNRIFPASIDNQFSGNRIALWLLGLATLLRFVIGVNSIARTAEIAKTADGIPVDTFPVAAAQHVLQLFALLGFSGITLALIALIALIRYRAMVPMIFVIYLVDNVGKRMVNFIRPVGDSLTTGGTIVGLILPALMLAGLALSLTPLKTVSPQR